MNTVLQALQSLGFDWHVALANLFNFFLIFFVLKYFFFGTIKESLTNRKNLIEKGIEDAEKAGSALKNAEVEKKNIIDAAETKADLILSSVEKKSQILADSIQVEAEQKAQEILLAADKKGQKLIEISESDIQSKVPGMAADMVEKILKIKMTKEENDRYIEAL